ncbi:MULTISPECIES: alpha/beta hydrolase [unclassified Mameliella]|uniref:alpha/beta hydrolase n=1 Tax=unclassified Mameliella TaxID=2630630 RepID=UPI00273D2219|nr:MULTISPECIES: alpha/beta hydrolase [unclassified Mameliella]
MTRQDQLAPGMAEAIRTHESLSDAEAATFWAEGADWVPTEDTDYTGAAGQPQAARVYHGAAKGPVALYIHGGGWTGGSIALNERACQIMARDSGCTVVSISYRLAPEHPFPAGLQDCRAAIDQFCARFAGRPFVLSGASAGGNLALALAFDRPVQGLLLYYGVFGDDFETSSYRHYAEGYGLTRARMQELFTLYDPQGHHAHDLRLCPLKATDGQFRRLPPTCLIAAGLDVLRDDTTALADRLRRLDIPHSLHVEPGVTHGFINRGRLVPAADACLTRAARFLADPEQP